ncbi:MAG: YidC/Oxa1 family membrane protein insertase [Fastidiosipilaceae bacterium]|jgi:YidC/Oxa1 family membrane protein insertase|nr:YidC/Oxa1 family membrane protein insertase [Clostridiaceae bacterium]
MGTLTSMIVTGSILSPLYTAFGWLMLQLYTFLQNYGVVIILFTILLRALLLPLNVKQHKNMLKTQGLSRDQQELARIYGDDKAGLQQAQMELMKKHGISQSGGCLLSVLQLFLIWPIFRIFTAPLKYIVGISDGNLSAMGQLLLNHGLLTDQEAKMVVTQNIPLLNTLQHNPAAFAESVNNGWIRAGELIDLNFLGLNLGLKPSWKPSDLFGADMSTYLPLLIIPVIAVITTFLVSKIQEWTNPMYWRIREEKELAKNNPARSVSDAPAMQGMTSSMKWIMPIFTLFTVFAMPAAMGLYWIAGNFMALVQQVLFYFLYTKPTYANRRQEGLTNADLRRGKGKSLVAPGVGPVDESTTLLDGKSVSKSGQKKSSNKKSNKKRKGR